MKNLSSIKARPGSWFNLILESRRKYAGSKLRELDRFQPSSLKRILKWLYLDARFILQQCKEIFSELKIYGPLIKHQYGISIIKQILQQLYLVCFLRVSLKHYRGYLLFKKDRWARVQHFTYENYSVQMKLVNNSFPEEQNVFDDKLNFYKHCKKNNIYTPPVFGVFKDGREILSGEEPFTLPAEDLFIKELCGRRGQGITKYNFLRGMYNCSENEALKPDELVALLRAKSRRNEGMIIQKPLQNHEKWRIFTSGALSTCRVLTARSTKSRKIVVVAATLRMPVGSTETDNTSTGGIASAVGIETGILGMGIRKTPFNGRYEFYRHPDTNQRLFGTKVPLWDDLLKFAANAHRAFDTVFVGWDIALTGDGFALVEGNIGWSVRVVESPQATALSQTQFPGLYEGWMKRETRKNEI